MMRGRFGLVAAVCVGIAACFGATVDAYRFSSTSYVIDASVANNFGGSESSSSYKLVGTGGESIIGNGSSGSYIMPLGYVAQLPSSLQLTVQPSGLLAFYPLDEPSGTLVHDQSANSIDGAFVATPTPAAGKVGGAYTFDGATGYAKVGSSSSLTGTEFTIEAWVKTTTSNAIMAAVTKGGNFWLGVNYGKASIYDWTTSTTCSATTPTVTDGTWHHIAVTLKSGVTTGSVIYIDGVQRQTCTWTALNQVGQPGIGAAQGSPWQQFFNGTLDHVKILSRAMTAEEIAAEYGAQNAGYDSGLTLQTITPGVSNSTTFDVITNTNAPGYNLGINQNHDLQSGGYTIPAVSGTIASPVTWNEGSTTGLGFSLVSTNATPLPGLWGSGAKYAALPGTSTSYYTRTGQPSAKDVLTMRLRVDTATSQPIGTYTNLMTITGTITP